MKRWFTLLAILASCGAWAQLPHAPDDFLAGPGWRAKAIREFRATKSYTNELVDKIIEDLSLNNGQRVGVLDCGIYSGTARATLSVTNEPIHNILWWLVQEGKMTISLVPEGYAFTIHVTGWTNVPATEIPNKAFQAIGDPGSPQPER